MGAHGSEGRQAKGKARLNAYEQMLGEEQKEREEKLEIFIPNGPASRQQGDRGSAREEGFR